MQFLLAILELAISSMANNPWFYVVGVVAIFFACRNLWVLKKLPAKPKKIDGKKTIW